MNITLSQIIEAPERVPEVPPEMIPVLLVQLAAVQSVLAARMMERENLNVSATQNAGEPDRLLTAGEAALILNVKPRWLYRHWKHLPFARRLSRKTLRFSENGLRKWQGKKRA